MDAGLSGWLLLLERERELTGSPVRIYARTMDCSISCSRALRAPSPFICADLAFRYIFIVFC
jgi:hypothetical protein